MDYSDILNASDMSAEQKLVRILLAHKYDIILALKSRASTLSQLGELDKEQASYLYKLADDIFELIQNT